MQQWILNTQHSTKVAPGLVHTHLIAYTEEIRQSVQILTLDTKNPFTTVETVSYASGVTKLETMRNLAMTQKKQGKNVVAAVNGDFFSSLGIPLGLQITNGEIITSPHTTKVAMGIFSNNQGRPLTNILMQGELVTKSGSLTINAINRTRRLSDNDHLVVYSSAFGSTTKTPRGGLELVLKPQEHDSLKLRPGQTLLGEVFSISRTCNTSIPDNGLVLSLTGEKARWIEENMQRGESVQLFIDFDQDVSNCIQVISGNGVLGCELLANGKLTSEVLNPDNEFYRDRHPRTILGTKGDDLLFIVIDGRKPGFSDGVTFLESATLLQRFGIENAINIDGGGSTTCLVRGLGSEELELVNAPSDGFERAVGNGLIIVNDAPSSDLEQLLLTPGDTAQVLAGSKVDFQVRGIDKHYNPVQLDSNAFKWEICGDIGLIDATGQLILNQSEGLGQVRVQIGNVVGHCDLQIKTQVAKLAFSQTEMVLEPDSRTKLDLMAWDTENRPIYIDGNVIDWSIEGPIGTWKEPGVLMVASEFGEGAIVASYNGTQAKVQIQVGKEPVVLEDFASIDNLQIISRGTVKDSVAFDLVSRPYPIRFGAFSGQLTYDFTGQTGSSSVTIQLLDEAGNIGRQVPGEPQRLGLWVYGDSQNHWLRVSTIDAVGNKRNLNFTSLGGLNWTGWKYVLTDIPANTVYPLTILGVVLLEPSDANKNAGVIYLDYFRAEYVNLAEDVEGPFLTDFYPKAQSLVADSQLTLKVKIKDEQSGVDANSIRMWINDKLVEHYYDLESNVLSYQPRRALDKGKYEVQVHVADQVGNPSLPLKEWIFYID